MVNILPARRFWNYWSKSPLGSVHTALAIAMHSLAIDVLAKEWVGMPFLSEFLNKNPVFFQYDTAITKASVNGTVDNIQFPLFWHR